MRIERATITAMRLVEHIEVHLHATDTIIQSNQAAVRRTLMDAIAIGLAIYSHPERNGPTNGWTKGHTDEPSFQAQDPSNLQHLTARARRAMKTAIELQTTSQNDASNSRWTRHWDPKNQTTVTDIVRLRDQHKCVIVRTSMQPNNSDSSPGNRLGEACRHWWPSATRPEEANAILLLDDIDAHQNATVTGTVRELHTRFAKLQIIATASDLPPEYPHTRCIRIQDLPTA